MLAEMVKHTIGIDPDRDWITASIVDTATTGGASPAWDMLNCWSG